MSDPALSLAVHATEPRSRANGPGARFVIWVQGCSLACPGCFNPDTHARADQGTPIEELAIAVLAEAERDVIEGVTISGGEPLEQPAAVLALVRAIRARAPDLTLLVFSGYRREEIEAMPLGPAILAELDVLVDGRYQAPDRVGRGLRGSANQRIWTLTDRYRVQDVEATPEAEIRIAPDGSLVFTGVAPLRIK